MNKKINSDITKNIGKIGKAATKTAYKGIKVAVNKGINVVNEQNKKRKETQQKEVLSGNNGYVCPRCNANINISEDSDVIECEYCGATFKNKKTGLESVIKYAKDISNERNSFKQRKYNDKIELRRQQAIEKKKQAKTSLILLACLSVFSIGCLTIGLSGSEKKHDVKEEELQGIVAEIQTLIEEEDYDNALIKANLLHDDTNWSSDSEKKWDETRESLIELINEKKKQKSNTNVDTENNVIVTEEPIPVVEQEDNEFVQDDDTEVEEIGSVGYVQVTADTVRIRSSASTDNDDNIIGKASKGDKYTKIGSENDWCKISFDGKEGYIKSDFLKAISQEDFNNKLNEKTVQESKEESPEKSIVQEDTNALLQQQQQAALLEQQAALLAQQQAAEALALQQAAAQTSNSSGGTGTWENAQLNADRTVYVTPTGKKYHYDSDCAGKNARAISISNAGAYGPCGTCVLR